MIILGETRTGIVQDSKPIGVDRLVALLSDGPAAPVDIATRPIAWATSRDRYLGVDCQLATVDQSRVQAIGTVSSKVGLIGGRIVQGHAFTEVVQTSQAKRRLHWSHYLARPGTVELIGKAKPEALVAGHIGVKSQNANHLALGAIAERHMNELQRSRLLDQRPPFKAARTNLRWAALLLDDTTDLVSGRFLVLNSGQRVLELRMSRANQGIVQPLCESIAFQDWLLTTVIMELDRSGIPGGDPVSEIQRLKPIVEHLLHLWMPPARLEAAAREAWLHFDEQSGFTRQWEGLVARIRDYIAVNAAVMWRSARDWEATA